MYCPNCGKEVEKDARFCGYCGYEFDQKNDIVADREIDSNFVDKVKRFLTEPSKTFDFLKKNTLGDAMKYYIVLAAISSALYALLFTLATTLFVSMTGFRELGMRLNTDGGIAGWAISIFVVYFILLIIGVFIGGVIIHIGVYIVGGKKGIEQTIKALMYGQTPGLLLGWIPIIGIIGGIWSLVLAIIGLRQLHELTTGKAILAVIIPIILIIVLIVILLAIIAAFVFGIGS